MKRELKEQWIKALTDGSYVQGKGYLKQWNPETNAQQHCCLGVLCELVGGGTWHQRSVPRAGFYNYWFKDADSIADRSFTNLTRGLVDKTGVSAGGEVSLDQVPEKYRERAKAGNVLQSPDGPKYVYLADLNDSGFTFAEIAEIIQAAIPEED